MIAPTDFLITRRGILTGSEIAEGDIVLGIQNGQKKWTEITRISKGNGNAIRVYGEQCEFTVFDSSVVITNRGREILYKEVESANIYDANPKLPKALIQISDLGNQNQSDANSCMPEILERVDVRLLATLSRRLEGEKKVIIKMHRDQAINVSELFHSVKARRVVGKLWDWIIIDSDIIAEVVKKWWPIPTIIPQFVRMLSPVKLAEFCKGLLSCYTAPDSIGKNNRITYWTFETERDARQMIFHFLTATQIEYQMTYTPLYSPHICEIGAKTYVTVNNVVKTSRHIGLQEGVRIFSDAENWYPVVNLTPFYAAVK